MNTVETNHFIQVQTTEQGDFHIPTIFIGLSTLNYSYIRIDTEVIDNSIRQKHLKTAEYILPISNFINGLLRLIYDHKKGFPKETNHPLYTVIDHSKTSTSYYFNDYKIKRDMLDALLTDYDMARIPSYKVYYTIENTNYVLIITHPITNQSKTLYIPIECMKETHSWSKYPEYCKSIFRIMDNIKVQFSPKSDKYIDLTLKQICDIAQYSITTLI